MNNLSFWESLKTNWSSIQSQAKSTKFDSELLKEKIHNQITNAKIIREKNYGKYDILLYADDEDEEY